MVETRRSSSSSNRPFSASCSPPLPNGKRSKVLQAAEASSSTNETPRGPLIGTLGQAKESGCESNVKVAWGKLLSQCSQLM